MTLLLRLFPTSLTSSCTSSKTVPPSKKNIGMMLEPKGHVRQRSFVKLEADERDMQIAEPLLEGDSKYVGNASILVIVKRTVTTNGALALLWALSLVLVSVCTHAFAGLPSSYSFAAGYTTELADARSSISIVRRQFEGSLDFKARHGFIPPESPSLQYIGSSLEVDAAWNELTDDRYFLLSDDEARAAYGQDISKYWNEHHGGYVAGLDVLHTLHCLNHLRKTLYPRAYPQDPANAQTHSAHCIDHLRQLAMCQADLTPIPTQYFPGIGQNYINSSREHTCRDFWQVRDWATERFNGSTAVKQRNRDGSPRDNFYGPWG